MLVRSVLLKLMNRSRAGRPSGLLHACRPLRMAALTVDHYVPHRYGMDRRDGRGLAGLLRELGKLEGLRWIRLLYCYPSYFTEDLIDEIASNPKVVLPRLVKSERRIYYYSSVLMLKHAAAQVVKYIDIPLQASASALIELAVVPQNIKGELMGWVTAEPDRVCLPDCSTGAT